MGGGDSMVSSVLMNDLKKGVLVLCQGHSIWCIARWIALGVEFGRSLAAHWFCLPSGQVW